jgi:hypothetical protein
MVAPLQQLLDACRTGNLVKVTTLAAVYGETLVNARVPGKVVGYTVLHWVCERCGGKPFAPELARCLVRYGANVHAAGAAPGPLQLACSAADGPHVELARVLIAAGARTLPAGLLYVVARGSLELVKLMLESGADVNANGFDGNTALHVACKCGHEAIVAHLLRVPGVAVDARNDLGQSPLFVAACFEFSAGCCRLLLQRGADANAADAHGVRPLTGARVRGHAEVVRELLAAPDGRLDMANARPPPAADSLWSAEVEGLVTAALEKRTCQNCRRLFQRTSRCSGCVAARELDPSRTVARFCGKECQKKHWKAGHNKVCTDPDKPQV